MIPINNRRLSYQATKNQQSPNKPIAPIRPSSIPNNNLKNNNIESTNISSNVSRIYKFNDPAYKSTRIPKDIYYDINVFIKDSNNILFGPMVGEFGWEIIVWTGIIRKIKIDNPKKNIIVATRNNRKELYEDLICDVVGFDIRGDYTTVRPSVNTIAAMNPVTKKLVEATHYKNELNYIIDKYKNMYSDLKIIDTTTLQHSDAPPTDLSKLYYNFETKNQDCLDYITNIISNNPNKHIILLNPRNRLDLTDRNMDPNNWHSLYDYFSTKNDCLFFISGVSPSYVKPKIKYQNIFNLEDISNENNNFTVMGLTIPLLKYTCLVFGMDSANTHMARTMGIPALYIGQTHGNMGCKLWNVYSDNMIEAIVPDKFIPTPYLNGPFGTTISVRKIIEKYEAFFNKIKK